MKQLLKYGFFISLMFYFSCATVSPISTEFDPMDNSTIITYKSYLEYVRGSLENQYIYIVRKFNKKKNRNLTFQMEFYGYKQERASKDSIELKIDNKKYTLPIKIQDSYTTNGSVRLTPETEGDYRKRDLWYVIHITVSIPQRLTVRLKNSKSILLRIYHFDNIGETSSTFRLNEEQIVYLHKVLSMKNAVSGQLTE